ncbi:MAG TPA: prolipoprotein diacylglyceryl transferase [Ignavibacteria bacterium]|nr:prolipoprotein diacylglyceryl transferase [Ignavibacteria bacterium]
MYPKLFEIGPVPVYSYGLMLGIAFLIANSLLSKELKRNNMDEGIGPSVTFIALIAGLLGSKLFYILEEWNFGSGISFSAMLKPDILFSPSGLTFYGGLICATISLFIFCRIKKIQVFNLFDMLAPGVALAYGIARIGCHLSGDGDYGIAVNGTMWEFIGYSYANGTIPTAPGVLVHPTPLYELTVAVIIFLFLWNMRTKKKFTGEIFAFYLILTGLSRLLVEFIRLNPLVIFGLSQAQLISIGMIIIGILIFILKSNREKKV